jgi:predicted phage tail protein
VAINAIGSSSASTATVAVPAVLAISTATLPAGAVNAAYPATTVASTGGIAPYTWSATSLPAGLTMSATGVISGTPTPAAVLAGTSTTYTVVATITDSSAPAASKSATFSLVIKQVLPAAPTTLAATAKVITSNKLLDSVTLTWADVANNESGYEIQTAVTPLFLLPASVTVAANTTTYNQNVLKKLTYYYRVRAINAAGKSAWSSVVKVTAP